MSHFCNDKSLCSIQSLIIFNYTVNVPQISLVTFLFSVKNVSVRTNLEIISLTIYQFTQIQKLLAQLSAPGRQSSLSGDTNIQHLSGLAVEQSSVSFLVMIPCIYNFGKRYKIKLYCRLIIDTTKLIQNRFGIFSKQI